jgi:hypothetical protein
LDEPESMIPLDWLYDRLAKCQADLKLVMIDACRDVDPFLGGKRSASQPDRGTEMRSFIASSERLPDGLILLRSCSEGETAAEDPTLGHGVFTHFLLEGMRGKADENANQDITLNELVLYASRETKLYVRDRFADIQRPKIRRSYTVEAQDFKFVSLSKASSVPPTLPLVPSNPASVPANDSRPSGERYVSKSTGMEFVLIPAGTFTMGSPTNEPGRDDDETQHRVTLTRAFYLGKYEVTQAEFERVLGFNPSGFTDSKRLPVERVSWYDAVMFCNRLSELDGRSACYQITDIEKDGQSINRATVQFNSRSSGYRLPTEAEWEYACRAGTTTPFSFGRNITTGDATIPMMVVQREFFAKRRSKSMPFVVGTRLVCTKCTATSGNGAGIGTESSEWSVNRSCWP